MKNGQILTVSSKNKADLHEMEHIVIKGEFNPKAKAIFEWMFDIYSDPELGVMTKETCVHFIRGCTGDDVKISDNRISGIFS